MLAGLSSCAVHTVSSAGSAVQAGSEPPLRVDVLNAIYIGGELNVKVKVVSKTDLPTQEVALALLGLTEGRVTGEKVFKLSELYDQPVLKEDEPVIALLTLQSNDLSEYQVKTSWGDDAKELLKEAAQTSGPPNLPPANPAASPAVSTARSQRSEAPVNRTPALPIIVDLQADESESQCRQPPCDINYTLILQLRNTSAREMTNIHLAVGLFWEEQNRPAEMPQAGEALSPGEEDTAVSNLVLLPGQTKRVRIAVDQSVPRVRGGRFVPNARVLSATSL